jgi:hypothetical protein
MTFFQRIISNPNFINNLLFTATNIIFIKSYYEIHQIKNMIKDSRIKSLNDPPSK